MADERWYNVQLLDVSCFFKGDATYDTGVAKQALTYNTALCSRHTLPISSKLPGFFCRDEELSRKLSFAGNGRVLHEIRCFLVHRHNIQTDFVSLVICDIGIANTLFTAARNFHDTSSGSGRRCHGWFGVWQGYDWSYRVAETVLYSTRYAVSWCTSNITNWWYRIYAKKLFTAPVSQIPYLRHCGTFTAHMSVGQTLTRLFWHGVELLLKPFCTRNSPVLTWRDTRYPGKPAAAGRCHK